MHPKLENAYSRIEYMIEVLQVAAKSPVFGYKKNVEGNDADD
jgi:hypothetical protein